MLAKEIQYTSFNGEDVVEKFYFNFTQLEIIEMVQVHDLQGTIKKLTETDDGPAAYDLFKKLILDAYGEKSDDGRQFRKTPAVRENFEYSAAMPVMIMEFLANPDIANEFIARCLPQEQMQAALAEIEKQKNMKPEEITELVEEAARRQANPETRIEPGSLPTGVHAPRQFDEYTREELLQMPTEEYLRLIPKDVTEMSEQQLNITMERRKNAE